MTKLLAAYLWHQLRSYAAEGDTDIIPKLAESVADLTTDIVQHKGLFTQFQTLLFDFNKLIQLKYATHFRKYS